DLISPLYSGAHQLAVPSGLVPPSDALIEGESIFYDHHATSVSDSSVTAAGAAAATATSPMQAASAANLVDFASRQVAAAAPLPPLLAVQPPLCPTAAALLRLRRHFVIRRCGSAAAAAAAAASNALIPATSFSSDEDDGDDDEFYDAEEGAAAAAADGSNSAGSGSVFVPEVIGSDDDCNYDELYDDMNESNLGNLDDGEHGSVIGHLISQWYLSAFHAGRRSAVAKKPYNPILGEIFQCLLDTASANGQQHKGDQQQQQQPANRNSQEQQADRAAAAVKRCGSLRGIERAQCRGPPPDSVTFLAEQVCSRRREEAIPNRGRLWNGQMYSRWTSSAWTLPPPRRLGRVASAATAPPHPPLANSQQVFIDTQHMPAEPVEADIEDLLNPAAPNASIFAPGRCAHNTSDGEYMAGLLSAYGYSATTDQPDQADPVCCQLLHGEDSRLSIHARNEIQAARQAGKAIVVPPAAWRRASPDALFLRGRQPARRWSSWPSCRSCRRGLCAATRVRLLGKEKSATNGRAGLPDCYIAVANRLAEHPDLWHGGAAMPKFG
uniref:DUF3504 domain-containing protein n=1 Tax=Macrostomum lignano TaxID=282301 RepID=A0A1I8F603_9PLAT